MTGLPTGSSGRIVTTNAAGQFTLTVLWRAPGTHPLTLRDGSARDRLAVVVRASGPPAVTPPFAGSQVRFTTKTAVPPAIPAGFSASPVSTPFSSSAYHRVEGFTGMLGGHPFIVDMYTGYPSLFVGVNYNHRPLLFSASPHPCSTS